MGSDEVKLVTGELLAQDKQPTTADDFGFSEEVGYTIDDKSEGL